MEFASEFGPENYDRPRSSLNWGTEDEGRDRHLE